MLDLGFVRENLPLLEEKLRLRGMNPDELLQPFKRLDSRRRELIHRAESLQAAQNAQSKEIARLVKAGKREEAEKLKESTRNGREEIVAATKEADAVDSELRAKLATVPNLPHASVPVGKSPEDNQEIRRWGAPPKFDFAPKPHWELGEQLGVLDMERAAKLSGARFAVYWDLGARMERALANFMLDLHTREHGYTEVLPPYMVNSDSMYGTGQLP